MSRSVWKSEHNLSRTLDFELAKEKKIPITTYFRSSVILPYLVGHILHIHNGKKHIPVLITEAMLAHKVGEFVVTRGTFIFKKKGKRVKKKKGQ